MSQAPGLLSDPFLRDDSVQPPAPLRVLITRPDEQALETAELVRAAGGAALFHPCLRLAPPVDPQPLAAAVANLEHFSWVALASANAAQVLAPGLLRCARRPRIAAVGPKTAAVLQEHGLHVELCARASTAEGLRDELLGALQQCGRELAAQRVLLPRAAQGRQALAEGLAAAGVQVEAVTAYQMLPPPPAELAAMAQRFHRGEVDLVPFGSPRTVEIALGALGREAPALLRRTRVGAIGATTAAALRAHGVQIDAGGDGAPADFAVLLRALADAHRQRPR